MFPWINGLGVSSSTQASETISPQVSVWPSEPVLSPAALVSFSRAGFHGHLSLRKELVLFLLFFFLITLLGALHCRRETHQPHSPCSDVLPGLLRGCGLTNYGKPEATCPGSAFVPSDRLIAYRLAMPNKLAYIRKEVLIP